MNEFAAYTEIIISNRSNRLSLYCYHEQSNKKKNKSKRIDYHHGFEL